MWILFLLLTVAHPGVELETYATEAACKQELQRILIEMEKSYPSDRDYRLVCRFKLKVI